MSKQKARRRAEERARKRAPRRSDPTDGRVETTKPKARSSKKQVRSAREQRQRRRLWVVAAIWLVANALIWMFTDTWNARWFGLTITTILVPLAVWLIWDPERRVHL